MVLDLVIPEVGTVHYALSMIQKRCTEMKGAQGLCGNLLARLEEIHAGLTGLAAEERAPPDAALKQYVDVVTKFLQSLESWRASKLVYRVVEHWQRMSKLHALHEAVDGLYDLFHLTSTSAWRDSWSDDFRTQEKLLEDTARSRDIVRRELQEHRCQVEAYLTLKFSVEKRADRHNDRALAMMRSMMGTIRSVFTVQNEALPSWFVPFNEVTFEEKPFARGTYASVHHGRWGPGANVVVKCFSVDDDLIDRRAQRRIEKEIQIWHALSHPNVVQMFGASHTSSPPFIVCEDASNRDLGSFLAESEANKRRMWRLLHQAALGLDYIHSRGVVHGDLKLNNILVGADGMAKVADFGMSTMRSCSTQSLTDISRTTQGGLRWRAPECLVKQRRPAYASDVYSFGMCIIEAAVGEPPFSFLDDDDIRENRSSGNMPDQPDELSNDEWALVTSMIHGDPSRRCRLEAAIEKLDKFASNEVAQEEDVETWYDTQQTASSDATLEMEDDNQSSASRNEAVAALAEIPSDSDSNLPYEDNLIEDSAPESTTTVPVTAEVLVESQVSAEETLCVEETTLGSDTTSSAPQRQVVTSIVDLFATDVSNAVRHGSKKERKKALRLAAQACVDEEKRKPLFDPDIISVLINCVETKSSFHCQVYAMECLCWAADPDGRLVIEQYETLQSLVRDPTRAECEKIARLLEAEDEQKQIDAAVQCACIADVCARHFLHDVEVVAPLVSLLRDGNDPLKVAAAHALGNLADEATADDIGDEGAIEPLAELVRSGTTVQKGVAAYALGRLACTNDNMEDIAKAGALQPLITLIDRGTDSQKGFAVYALSRLADSNEVKRALRELPVVAPLVQLLSADNAIHREHAAYAVASLAEYGAYNREIIKSGGDLALINVVKAEDEASKEHAAYALGCLAYNRFDSKQIGRHGGIAPLVQLARTGTDRQKHYAACALTTLVLRDENKDLFVRDGGLCAFDQLLGSSSDQLKIAALSGLGRLGEKEVVLQGAVIKHVLHLLRTGRAVVRETALVTMNCFFKCTRNRDLIKGLGIIKDLVDAVRTGSDAIKKHAAYFLAYATGEDPNCHAQIVQAGAIPLLVELLRGEARAPKRNATVALWKLAMRNAAYRQLAVDSGAIPLISELLRSGDKAQKTQAAIAVYHFASEDQTNAQAFEHEGVVQLLSVLYESKNDHQKQSSSRALNAISASIEGPARKRQRCDNT